MWQNVIVFAVVAVCLGITGRIIYRVLAGKNSNCSLCDECGAHKTCGSKSTAATCASPSPTPPEGAPQPPAETADKHH